MGAFSCGNLTDYTAFDCANDRKSENRVSGIAILKDTTVAKDLLLPATWDDYTGETPTTPIANDMIVVSELKGTYNGGEFNKVEGFGAKLEIINDGTHELVVEGVFHRKHISFLNSIMKATNYGIAFVNGDSKSGDLQVMQGKDIAFISKTEIIEAKREFRKFMITATWSYDELVPVVDVEEAVKALFF